MDAQWRVALSDIDIGPAEEAAVIAVVRSKWLTMGDRTAEFEREFAAACGARHAIAVNSCTAALHLALIAAAVHRPGDSRGPGKTVRRSTKSRSARPCVRRLVRRRVSRTVRYGDPRCAG